MESMKTMELKTSSQSSPDQANQYRSTGAKDFADHQKFKSINFAIFKNSFRHCFVFFRSAIRSFGRAALGAAGLCLAGLD